MGWYYGINQSRADVIAELTPASVARDNGNGTFKTLRKYTSGNTLWTVHEHDTADGRAVRWIGCYLLGKSGGSWGYKPMEESMHPYYYSCPLAFLDMVPELTIRDGASCAAEGTCQAWRANVRKYHAERNAKLAKRRQQRAQLRSWGVSG